MAVLEDLQTLISDTATNTGGAIVGLAGRRSGRGSGVVIAEGRVLTAAHNLRTDEPTVVFADDRRADATVLGIDPTLDLAVLGVDTADAPVIPVASSGPDSEPGIGTPVLALARPGGRGLRVTTGFVSAAQRSLRPRGRRVTAIEHTAPLPRGSSGGPLLDSAGNLIGVNAVRLDGGLILAIATTPLASAIDRLSRGEAPARRELGVAVVPPHVARRLRRAVGLPERDGVLVRAVRSGSPAEAAGLERGDLITAAGGREATGLDALHAALDEAGESGSLELELLHGTEERKVAVDLTATDGDR